MTEYLIQRDGHWRQDESRLDRTEQIVGYTPIHNMAGCPAMSVPLAWSSDGLPIGMHVAAAPGRDALLLQLAYQLKGARPWRHRRPTASLPTSPSPHGER